VGPSGHFECGRGVEGHGAAGSMRVIANRIKKNGGELAFIETTMSPTRRELVAMSSATIFNATALVNTAKTETAGPKFKAVGFDAFTIFDPSSVTTAVEESFPGKGKELSDLWRTRQFEYCWPGASPVARQPPQEFHRSLEACMEHIQVNGIRSLAGCAEPPPALADLDFASGSGEGFRPSGGVLPCGVSAPAGRAGRRPKACFSLGGIGYRRRPRSKPDRARLEALARGGPSNRASHVLRCASAFETRLP
jgi:hypothetical protein